MGGISAARRAAIAEGLESFSSVKSSPKPVRLIYTTQPSWPYPAPSSTGGGTASADSDLDIAVLDSSFNPPTKAHAALALSKPLLAGGKDEPRKKHYDAHLLLFSSRNADKGSGKAGDASPSQRLEMMELLAKYLEGHLREDARSENAGPEPNVAVALVEEPLMVSKSTLAHDLFRSQHSDSGSAPSSHPRPRLHWVVGFDTLERFFMVKYYPSPDHFVTVCRKFFEEERTTFVCARRNAESLPNKQPEADKSAEQLETELLEGDLVQPWVEKGMIGMLDLPAQEGMLSSTSVRKLLTSVSPGEERRQRLAQMVPDTLVDYLETERVYDPNS